ncbi:PDDEXK nuclease domain-containing protein [Dolichospermum circinale]|uniref:PDDEXK nuclease domain-containing protein n=1 Tax=Dolichospermum circinale TaxID=109265 RepID=UPI00047F8F83|nr:PDDEXK nuclease domain-containing protein [Dolichospermum circinale]MDB9457997.1 PDDEXK nuclease domain-containing protein [Dolichospermum circinale CS-545/17]MDB9466231.1 PDDEXK nuclease domain-containing protein [Dolichospermum circinale CS-539/09]MDB9471463.1 PDDEXK nuclease domain-containing protein [Dolichospermum circinale CS-539]
MSNSISDDYTHLLMEVQQRIRSAQYEALKAVNREMINLYWDIGQMIVIKQQDAIWGKSVVEKLAKDLQTEFPGISGFSARNIWNMRNFYVTYSQNEKLQPMVAEIGWTHNIVILEKCKDDLEREFYIRMTRKFGWTKNVLIHQIENQTYEKTLVNQTNFDQNISVEIRNQLKLAVKDEYTFDFLELADEHSERQLEESILAKIQPFLQEMGGIFAFIGSQYRLEVDDEEYFIDILLYHRRLKCLVAIELKIGKFLPEYVGKMQFYLAVLDETVKLPEENPSIGIILCKSKQRTIVEYALKESNKPIGVATYQIVSKLPQELKNQLPDPEQVAKLLEGFE